MRCTARARAVRRRSATDAASYRSGRSPDRENRGFLTPAGFSIVLRLIGHAQAGREPTAELALQPGQLPRFDGFATAAPVAVPSLAAQPTATRTHSPLQAQGTGGGQVRLPPLTPEKVAQYTGLFERQSLLGGNMLPGDQAKQIFEKSGLPNEILGRIWQLADTEGRGSLVLTEFVIAMHLLTSLKTGALRGLPAMVPAVLYEAATRWGAAVAPRQHSPAAAAPAISAIPRQLSGQAHHLLRTGSPLGRAPLQAQTTGGDWLITPGDKARFDLLYEELDKAKRGFITGEEAVPFLSQSNLPEDALAQIWDLSDVNSEGRLTRDTFAVAMYLIRQQRSKRDGSITTLPSVLPPNLIPPSMRGHIQPLTATSMSPFDAPPPPPLLPPPQQRQQPAAVVAAPPPPPQPTSALDDLFGLDALTPPPPPPAASQASMQATGASAMSDPFASASPPRSSSPAKASPTAPSFKPFVPSSSFGRTLASHVTGDSNSSAPSVSRSAAPQLSSSAQDDLLGDNEAEASKKLTSDSTELANLSNQIGSLSRHMQEVQGQRTATQVELNQASAQKKNFEQRLSQLRALYEKEAKDVRALEEQLNSSRSETRKIQTEMAMLDATHQDLQNQHRQISTALQADRDENASLKERIRLVNAEIAQLKPQIEKLKSEARQQKGLVAINKKQLVTSGGERDKLKTEVDDLTRSNEELARQINSASSPGGTAGGGTQVASPVLSPSSGNNPFFKRTASTDIMGTFASPAPTKSFNDKSFDDVFGPAFPSTPNQAVNAFNAQHTGTSTASAGSFATPATSTPNVSRQPAAAVEQQPPPPPSLSESRQMSPGFLPFSAAPESLTSSRQVSPPVSRLGHVEPAATPEPPSNSNNTVVSSPAEAADVGQSMTSRSDGAKNAAAASSPTGTKPASNGGGSSPPAAGPAADAGPGHSHSDSLGSPFSVLDEAKAKEDFESAFASHKKARTKAPEDAGPEAPKALRAFDTEFPPITELEKHDESDSESDRAGFEDDFAPASPRPAENARTIQQAPPSPAKVEEPVGKSVEDPIDRYGHDVPAPPFFHQVALPLTDHRIQREPNANPRSRRAQGGRHLQPSGAVEARGSSGACCSSSSTDNGQHHKQDPI